MWNDMLTLYAYHEWCGTLCSPCMPTTSDVEWYAHSVCLSLVMWNATFPLVKPDSTPSTLLPLVRPDNVFPPPSRPGSVPPLLLPFFRRGSVPPLLLQLVRPGSVPSLLLPLVRPDNVFPHSFHWLDQSHGPSKEILRNISLQDFSRSKRQRVVSTIVI